MPLPLSDRPVTEVAWLDVEESPLAAVRFDGVRLADLPHLFDAAFGALGAAIGRGEIAPLGPALAIYDGDVHETFDVTVGFEVAQAPEADLAGGDVTIVASHVPAGRYACISHVGPYEEVPHAWGPLLEDVAAGGAEVAGPVIEVYVSDPRTTAPAQLRTDLLAPVVVTEV